ncbi:MAG TPA: hypothetical protein VIV12_23090 [Streptosporangiaceae bacterium]
MSNLEDALAGIADRSVYVLASDAEVSGPDGLTSPGAEFLDSVRRVVLEWWDETSGQATEDAASDAVSERGDSIVPIYNHERMQTLVDLAAYHEEIDDYGTPADMIEAAGWSLFMVAERLFIALAREAIAARDEDDES